MEPPESSLEDSLLLHLLDHRGHQVRFEADQWTTEFGIFRAFSTCGMGEVKTALRSLEMSRSIYRRMQYVIGYSEPKLVFSLTPGGHRRALVLKRRQQGLPEPEPEEEAILPTGDARAEWSSDGSAPPSPDS
jgi:hypothetical protein